jgi:glc operon protein GlcG
MQAGHILCLSTPLVQFPTFSEVTFALDEGISMILSGYAHIFAIELTQTMKTKHFLESADIKAIAAAAEAEALKNHWAVTIAIVDDGGHLLHLQRLDGAPPVSSHIAPAKANTAALGRRESKIYEDVINNGRMSFLSAPTIEGMLEGGVPIIKDGQVIGAVGVSGVKSNEDAQIAKAGIAAIGL